MHFGQTLKKLRTSNNVTQQDLADYLKVSRPTIAGYETKDKEPDYKTLILIADYFNISVDYLIRDDYSMSASSYENTRSDTLMILIETISALDTADLHRLLDYVNLIKNQPKYNKKDNNN
jgi:transcriptional regulator with XRE-family HTH domain